jgi:hypothetical protein
MKALKILFYSFLILFGLLVTTAFVVAKFYGDDIKSYVVTELNKNLKTKVDVKTVGFTILESFPLASVQFSEVVIYSSLNKADTMLFAQKIACKFNLRDLYYEKYELLEIEIESGKCHLLIDENKKENFIFWNSSDSSSSNFKVNLEQVELNEIHFSFQDIPNEFISHFYISDASAAGSLTDKNTSLNLKTTLRNSFVKTGKFKAIENRTLFIAAIGTIDQENKTIQFDDANIGLENLNFIVNGGINYKEETSLNLSVSTKSTDLKKAISVLPESIANELSEFEINGEATVKGSIKGKVSAKLNPSFSFEFSISEGSFKKKNSTVFFSQSFLNGSIDNGSSNNLSTTKINIANFKTKLNQNDISGNLKLLNPNHPKYEFNGSINFDLADAVQLLSLKEIENPKGKIESNISLTGKLDQFENYSLSDFKKSTIRGQVNLIDIELRIPNEQLSIKSTSGAISLFNASFDLDNLITTINDNKVKANGKLFNIIPFALSNEEKLIAELVLSSESVNLNSFIKESETKEKNTFQFPERLTLYLETKFNKVQFNNLILTELNGDLMMKDQRLDLRNLDFISQGGSVSGDYFLRKQNDRISFYAKSRLNSIDIKQVFASFNNFGQKIIKSENISGKTSSDISVSLLFDPYLNTILSSLKIDADLVVDNGALNNVKALEALSDFVELDELRSIKFKSLRNQLSVQDCTLTIPKFDIQSSAMNINLSGNHKFNNELDYHFVILLNEILGKKVKKPKNNEFGYEEDDGLGRTKIFMKMYGTTDTPKFGYDSQELKTHINTEVNQEKKTIKKLLNEEFGLFKKDTSIQNVILSEPQKKNPFKIEWEESKETENQNPKKKKTEKRGKFGKFIDKIAQPNEEEFVDPIEN